LKKITRRQGKSKKFPKHITSILKNLKEVLTVSLNDIKSLTPNQSPALNKQRLKRTAKWMGISVLVASVAFFCLFLAVLLGAFGEIPSTRELRNLQTSAPSEVYTADGVLIGRFFKQDRTNIAYHQISENVIKALIATEDSRFYKHHGIDVRSMLRVFFKTLLLQQDNAGGGSTISQQLAKNLFPRKHIGILSTPVNKLREMIIANRFEDVYSKQAILELYLNTVSFGGNTFGIERASQRFFDKPAKELRVEQAAVLVGMLKATSTYNPRSNPEKALQRRNVVLNQMVKYQFLDTAKATKLKAKPLTLDYNTKNEETNQAAYFKEYIRLKLEDFCQSHTRENGEPYNLYTDGFKIYTTLDSRIQKLAEKSVRNRMRLLQEEFANHWKGKHPWGTNTELIEKAVANSLRYKQLQEEGLSNEEIKETFRKPVKMKLFTQWGYVNRTLSPLDSVKYCQKMLNTGLLSIEPSTGFIKAWVGGIDFKTFKYDHVLAKRQVGSTFKPFVYAAALENGTDPCEYFQNARLSYPQYENWSPQNANGQYGGEYNMRGALAHSINTISAQILLKTGIQPTISFVRHLGIKSNIPAVPSIALGTANLSLMEMVPAYATFINEGKYREPSCLLRVTDRVGKPLISFAPAELKYAFSADNARTMLELLRGVVEEGSASHLRSEFGLSMDIAGKTGTTQNQADGWFIGITPDLVTGIWVGGESPLIRFRTLQLGQGSHTALPIWGDFMKSISRSTSFRNYQYSAFPPLSFDLQNRLSCPSMRYYEEPQPEEKKETFFDKIFKRKKDKKEKKKKGWKIFRW
jgi:penicillin-binding protein 1A